MESSEQSSDEQEAIKKEKNSPSSKNSGKDSPEGKCNVAKLVSTSGQQDNETAISHGSSQERTNSKVIWLLIGIAISSFLHYSYVQPSSRQTSIMPTQIESMVESWASTYRSSEKSWSIIRGQLRYFMEQEGDAPLVLVLIYKEGDEEKVKEMCSVLSEFAVLLKHQKDVCGDNEESKLKGYELNIKENFLVNVLPKIEKCKKMTLYNLEEMPPEAAQYLHSLLDKDNPNVKSAVYIFTVKHPKDDNLYQSVSGILQKRWSSKLNDDYTSPIISRLENFIEISTP